MSSSPARTFLSAGKKTVPTAVFNCDWWQSKVQKEPEILEEDFSILEIVGLRPYICVHVILYCTSLLLKASGSLKSFLFNSCT